MRSSCLVFLGCLAAVGPGADGQRAALLHIRYSGARITETFEFAMQHSATFRDLVGRLEEADAVVYVDEGACPGRVAPSCLHLLPRSTQKRLRIRIGPRQPLMVVVGQLAHELQHAVEIVGAAGVVDAVSLRRLYERIGFRTDGAGDVWETRQAQAIATAVLKEANAFGSLIDDSYFGTWMLNAERSTFDNAPAIRNGIRWQRDRGHGLVSVVTETIDANGVRARWAFVYRPDGRDYAMAADDDEPLQTFAETTIDRFTSQFVIKRDDRPAVFGRRVLERSGRAMTVESEGVDADGVPWKSVERWEKHHLAH
jgi:hypothetical protein